MSQQTVVSQTAPMDVYGPRIGIGPSFGSLNVDEAAPYGIELRAMNRTLDDVEAGAGIASTIPFPSERTVESAPQHGSDQQRAAKIWGRVKDLLLWICIALPLTIVFTIVGWAFGTMVLFGIPPFGSVGIWTQLGASSGGFAVVVPVAVITLTAIDQVRRRRRRPSSPRSGRAGVGSATTLLDRLSDLNVVFVSIAICAPMSVFAMPLGFAMLPSLATEAFWARHALVVSTAGFGAASVALLAALGLIETVMWFCVVYL